MAATLIGGSSGAVSFVSGCNCSFMSWRLRASHPVDDTSAYTDQGSGSSHNGSGVIDYSLTAAGAAIANTTTTALGMGAASATGTAPMASAGSVTLTAKTGCTLAGSFWLTGGEIAHSKRAGMIPVSYEGINQGNITETWATS